MSTALANLITPSVGIHRNVPFDEYVGWDAINHSTLRHFKRSPAHARYWMTHDRDSAALDLGTAVHMAVLEPERFRDSYAIRPPHLNKRSAKAKAEYAAWEEDTKGRLPLKEDEAQVAEELFRAIEQHPDARALLRGRGLSEVSLVGEMGGVLCKGRLDRLAITAELGVGYEEVWIGDLKTTPNASPSSFAKDAANFDYITGAAFYLDLLEAVQPTPPGAPRPRFAWIAVEKVAPYGIAVYEPEDEDVEQARRENARALSTYRACRDAGVWTGYPTGVMPLSMPRWWKKENA